MARKEKSRKINFGANTFESGSIHLFLLGGCRPPDPLLYPGGFQPPRPPGGGLAAPVPPCSIFERLRLAVFFGTRSWYQNLGTKILVPRSWYQDPGTKILIPRSWYQDLGTKILVSRFWYQVALSCSKCCVSCRVMPVLI